MHKLLFVLALFFITSCGQSYEETLLIGQWKTDSWIENNSGQEIAHTMNFNFDHKSHYTVDYGSMKEEGKYWIMGPYLHTIEKGEAEKKVLIKSLSKDTMIIEMNRTGSLERVVLLKS